MKVAIPPRDPDAAAGSRQPETIRRAAGMSNVRTVSAQAQADVLAQAERQGMLDETKGAA